MPRKLALVAPPGCRQAGLATVLDLCEAANRYAAALYDDVEPTRAVEVHVLSLDGAPAHAADGRTIHVDGALASEPVYDGVFLAAIEVEDAANAESRASALAPLTTWLVTQHARGAHVAASGSGIFLLAKAGLLAGGRAAPPWRLEAGFRRRYPGVALSAGPAVVDWGRVYTAGSFATEPALALRLLEAVGSRNLGDMLAKLTRIATSADYGGDEPVSSADVVRHDPVIARAQYSLQRNFSHRVSLETLANDLGVSQRTLLRRFRSSTGMSPLDYLQHLRIESAKEMLAKTTRPIARICYMVGYADLGFFKGVFKRRVGKTPAEYRSQARRAPP